MDNLTIIEGSGDAAIADWLAGRLRDALGAKDGPVTITVPGGSTPFPIIAAMLEHDLDWTRVGVWPGDDRIVPEDHAASNTGRLRDLFEPAGVVVIPGANPSVENVALYCMNEAVDALVKQFPGQDVEYQIQVTIQETDNNFFTLERTVVI